MQKFDRFDLIARAIKARGIYAVVVPDSKPYVLARKQGVACDVYEEYEPVSGTHSWSLTVHYPGHSGSIRGLMPGTAVSLVIALVGE